MDPFVTFKSKIMPLDQSNVDTDQIVPKQFLKLIGKSGFGKFLFYDWRFNPDGTPKLEFILNDPRYAHREILLTRENFGSGSSREHAVWALKDYGFRAVIAPSFSDIFYGNCFKNGLLAIRLPAAEVDALFAVSDDDHLVEIDLPRQSVIANGRSFSFEIDEFRKEMLLNGLDSIALTERHATEIVTYEQLHDKQLSVRLDAQNSRE
jgi:3-isopropylmalate/(R)-2-methylmalate dehydratase small subunit